MSLLQHWGNIKFGGISDWNKKERKVVRNNALRVPQLISDHDISLKYAALSSWNHQSLHCIGFWYPETLLYAAALVVTNWPPPPVPQKSYNPSFLPNIPISIGMRGSDWLQLENRVNTRENGGLSWQMIYEVQGSSFPSFCWGQLSKANRIVSSLLSVGSVGMKSKWWV